MYLSFNNSHFINISNPDNNECFYSYNRRLFTYYFTGYLNIGGCILSSIGGFTRIFYSHRYEFNVTNARFINCKLVLDGGVVCFDKLLDDCIIRDTFFNNCSNEKTGIINIVSKKVNISNTVINNCNWNNGGAISFAFPEYF